MVDAVQVYRTSDGEMFQDQTEAQAHEAEVQNKVAIDTFIDKHFPIPAAVTAPDGTVTKKQNAGRGPARKAITLWLAEQAA